MNSAFAMKELSRGAEAVLYKEDNIIKHRLKKSYRLKVIDDKLRGFRTRREAKILKKLGDVNFPAPKLVKTDEKEKIEMEFISGDVLKNVLDKSDFESLSREIGRKVACLHNNNIIHSDLTTSNIILKNENEIYFIDFGLSFFSHKVEDMAVDLHLLKEALESKHYRIWEKCFEKIVDGYKQESKHGELVIKRLSVVEKRGRYKQKY